MANILDYIKWRGDLSFEQSEFNEVDSVIMARLSYFDFDGVFKAFNEEMTIKEAYEKYAKLPDRDILWKDDVKLFPAMAESERFKDIVITRFAKKTDKDIEEQFAALTCIMPDKSILISYRGTDMTVNGWKEDFNMSCMDILKSHLDCVRYFEEVAKAYPKKPLTMLGHSKGGNYAFYAAAFCDDKFKNRIVAVYNDDGPGLSEKAAATEKYKKVVGRMHSYVPQTSIIGRLLAHEEAYSVVQSNSKGIMQHDVYSWEVNRTKLVHLEEVDDGSVFVDETVRDYLKESSPEEREKFLNIVFKMLKDLNMNRITEFKADWIHNTKALAKEYQSLDKDSKKIIDMTVKSLVKIAGSNAYKNVNAKVNKTQEHINRAIERTKREIEINIKKLNEVRKEKLKLEKKNPIKLAKK